MRVRRMGETAHPDRRAGASDCFLQPCDMPTVAQVTRSVISQPVLSRVHTPMSAAPRLELRHTTPLFSCWSPGLSAPTKHRQRAPSRSEHPLTDRVALTGQSSIGSVQDEHAGLRILHDPVRRHVGVGCLAPPEFNGAGGVERRSVCDDGVGAGPVDRSPISSDRGGPVVAGSGAAEVDGGAPACPAPGTGGRA